MDVGNNVIGHSNRGQPVVANPGDGQLSDLDIKKDVNSYERTIPFKAARTTFRANETEETKKWDRLWKYHHQWDKDETGRRAYQDKINLTKALASTFELSGYQKDRVIKIVDDLDARRFNQIGGIVALSLGAIAYVRDEDAKTLDHRILGSDEFEEICDRHDVDGWSACRKVKKYY